MGSFSIWHWLIVGLVVFLVLGQRRSGVAAASPASDGLATNWALAIPRGNHDAFSQAERLRDDLAKRFRDALPTGVAMTTYQSPRGSGAVWIRQELVKPDAKFVELTLRTVIALTIDCFDYHRFEHVLRLEIGRGLYRRTVEGLTEFKDEDIRAIMAFAVGDSATFPWLASVRLRRFDWQLWRPNNRVKRLRRDWFGTGMNAAGWGLLIVGALNLVQQAEESCQAYDQCRDASFGMAALLAGACVLVTRWDILRRRRTLVLNTGKPTADPRSLVRMDSWQVTLTGLGERQQSILDAILQTLAQRKAPGVELSSERIGYASVDNKVEREQQVVTFRRAIAFVRLESYGKDLYVGWDSHINAGIWKEQDLGRGIDRVSDRPVVARRIVQGWQMPVEFDVGDANFLTEWLHACIVSVVKQQLAEYKIDQEIDFTIQRESRTNALHSTDPAAKQFGRVGAGLFKRTG